MLATFASLAATAADPVRITSPDKKITVELQTAKGEFGWTVKKEGKEVYSIDDIRLSINGKALGGKAAVKNVKQKVNKNSTIEIRMVKNGGYAAVIE